MRASVDRGDRAAHDLELCGWDVDTHDWRGDRAEADARRRVAPTCATGAVVLLHDGLGPGALRPGCDQTVRFAQMIARRAVAA